MGHHPQCHLIYMRPQQLLQTLTHLNALLQANDLKGLRKMQPQSSTLSLHLSSLSTLINSPDQSTTYSPSLTQSLTRSQSPVTLSLPQTRNKIKGQTRIDLRANCKVGQLPTQENVLVKVEGQYLNIGTKVVVPITRICTVDYPSLTSLRVTLQDSFLTLTFESSDARRQLDRQLYFKWKQLHIGQGYFSSQNTLLDIERENAIAKQARGRQTFARLQRGYYLRKERRRGRCKLKLVGLSDNRVELFWQDPDEGPTTRRSLLVRDVIEVRKEGVRGVIKTKIRQLWLQGRDQQEIQQFCKDVQYCVKRLTQ